MNCGDDYSDIINKKRPVSSRLPMDIPNRAKQFAPFAALKGFEEAIQSAAEMSRTEAENEIEKTRVFSEEDDGSK